MTTSQIFTAFHMNFFLIGGGRFCYCYTPSAIIKGLKCNGHLVPLTMEDNFSKESNFYLLVNSFDTSYKTRAVRSAERKRYYNRTQTNWGCARVVRYSNKGPFSRNFTFQIILNFLTWIFNERLILTAGQPIWWNFDWVWFLCLMAY